MIALQYVLARSKLPQNGTHTIREHFRSMDSVSYTTTLGAIVVAPVEAVDLRITPVVDTLVVNSSTWTLNVNTRIISTKVNMVDTFRIVIQTD